MLQSKLDTHDVSNLNNFCGTAHKVENLEQWFAEIETLCQSPKHKFIYGYWNNPDSEMHRNGVESPAAKEILSVVNRYTEQLADKLENTLLIITYARNIICFLWVGLFHLPHDGSRRTGEG